MSWKPFVLVIFLVVAVSGEGGHDSVHVATWRWDEVGTYITFSGFVVICGLARIAFHHAHWLSSRVPESCLMITIGIALGAIIYFASPTHHIPTLLELENLARNVQYPQFSPPTFFFLLLPPIILEAAYSLYDRAFLNNVGTVLLYAVVGTIWNIFTIGPLLYGLFLIGAMGYVGFELTIMDCLVFSTLIAAVDPVAVLAIFQEIGINKDLYYLVFGESLFNDAVTVVLYASMITFHGMATITGDQYGIAILAFLASSIGGFSIGALYGLLTAVVTWTTQHNEIRVTEPLAVLGLAYLSYVSAELFHFSGILSIIACGLVQAHYALKNTSRKSHTTVVYFTKTASVTSEAIIFLFLGILIVSDTWVWSTGFVLWTLLLCLVCRAAGVIILTWLANMVRSQKIGAREQFILAYGGLRGAIAFSLVLSIDEHEVAPKQLLVLTTLIVIFFTVFIQGSTIKPIVRLLSIKREASKDVRMAEEISDNLFSNLQAGIEEITGVHHDYVKSKLRQFDEKYLQPFFLVKKPHDPLARLNTKLFLTDHFAQLHGPSRLVEQNRLSLVRASMDAGIQMKPMTEGSNGTVFTLTVPVEEMRMRGESLGDEDINPERLRRSFRNHPHEMFPGDEPAEDEKDELRAQMLLQRHLDAQRITDLVNRQELPGKDGESAPNTRQ